MHKGCFELLEDQSLYLWWNLATLSARLELELRKILFASVCFPDYCSFNSYIYICETSAKKQEKSLYPLHHSKNLIGLLSEYKLLKGVSFGKCNGWHLGVPREK